MSVPYRLQSGVTLDEAIPFINDNFSAAVEDIKDLKVAYKVYGEYDVTNCPPGVVQPINFNIYAATPSADVGGLLSAYSLYVDPPEALAPGLVNLQTIDTANLFPSGANITGGKRAIITSSFILEMTDAYYQQQAAGFSTFVSNGITFYLLRYRIVFQVRNADSVAHNILTAPSITPLTAPKGSNFR